MEILCKDSEEKKACHLVSELYFEGVSVYGESFFEKA